MPRTLMLVLFGFSALISGPAPAQDGGASTAKADASASPDVIVPDGVIPDRIATGLVKGPVFRFALHNLVFSPDGKTLAAGSGDGMVFLWNLNQKKRSIEMKAQRVQAHKDWTFSIAWTVDGKQLVTGGGDNLIHAYNVEDITRWYRESKFSGFKGITAAFKGDAQKTFKGHTQDVHAVALTSDGRSLVSAGDDKQIIIWDFESQKIVRQLSGHKKQIPTLAVSPDDNLIATGSRDHTIRLWELSTGKAIRTLAGHTGDVMSVRFSPDGRQLASASYDGTVRVWNVENGDSVSVLKGHTGWVFSVKFSPDGKRLASAGDNTVRLWNLQTGEQEWVMPLKEKIFTKTQTIDQHAAFVAFSPAGDQIAVASTAGTATLLNAETGSIIRTILAWGKRLPNDPVVVPALKDGEPLR